MAPALAEAKTSASAGGTRIRRRAGEVLYLGRFTARYAVDRSGPSADIRKESASSASSAALSEDGRRTTASRSRSAESRVSGVDKQRLARDRGAADTVDSRVNERAERQVRVPGGVDRLELEVHRAGRADRRADPQRGLPVVRAVAGECARPHLRREPPVAVHRAAGQRDQAGQVGEHAGQEAVADVGEPDRPAGSANALAPSAQRDACRWAPLPACSAAAWARSSPTARA